MKTIEKIQYMTEKGQITLPVAWRRQVGTGAVVVRTGKGNMLEISPVRTEKDSESGWVSIFNAERDNSGKGVPLDDFLKVLAKIKKGKK